MTVRSPGSSPPPGGSLGRVPTAALMVAATTVVAEPVFADLPDLDRDLTSTRVIDERLVLLDYRVATAR